MKTFLLRIEDNLYSEARAKAFEINLSVNNYLLSLIEKDLGLLGETPPEVATAENLKESILAEITQKLIPQLRESILEEVNEKLSNFQSHLSLDHLDRLLPDIENDIVDDIADDFADDIVDDIADDIADDIVDDIADDIVDDIADDFADDIKDDIKDLAPGQLAYRLGIHKNTLTAKFKQFSPLEFANYTQSLDPDNKAWYRINNLYSCRDGLQDHLPLISNGGGN